MRYIHKHKIIHRNLKPFKEENFEILLKKGVGSLLFTAPELFEDDENEDEKNEIKYTNKVDVYSFGNILIFILTNKYPPKNVITGVIPKLSKDIPEWVRELICKCLSRTAQNRPTFSEIFEIMKVNNFDLFSDSKNKKLNMKQQSMKENIERRIMEIEVSECYNINIKEFCDE